MVTNTTSIRLRSRRDISLETALWGLVQMSIMTALLGCWGRAVWTQQLCRWCSHLSPYASLTASSMGKAQHLYVTRWKCKASNSKIKSAQKPRSWTAQSIPKSSRTFWLSTLISPCRASGRLKAIKMEQTLIKSFSNTARPSLNLWLRSWPQWAFTSSS